jgi:hypothetical protein
MYHWSRYHYTADLTDETSYFCSNDEPGQLFCWNFQEMRVRPTHYTIRLGLDRN